MFPYRRFMNISLLKDVQMYGAFAIRTNELRQESCRPLNCNTSHDWSYKYRPGCWQYTRILDRRTTKSLEHPDAGTIFRWRLRFWNNENMNSEGFLRSNHPRAIPCFHCLGRLHCKRGGRIWCRTNGFTRWLDASPVTRTRFIGRNNYLALLRKT